jgi:predicted secreted protein
MKDDHVIIVVSECIYNQFCKPGCRLRDDKTLEELKIYLASYPCVIVLKCPEEEIFGIFRFSATRKMMEKNSFFIMRCKKLAKETVQRIESYFDAIRTKGDQISKVIIIGVDGSPVCGIERQLDSNQPVPNFGRPKKTEDWDTTVEGSGILIELLKKELGDKDISFVAFGVENLKKTREKVKLFINQEQGDNT